MNRSMSGDSDFPADESDREISQSVLELVSGALGTVVAVWQLEDDLVCIINRWAPLEQRIAEPVYLDTMATRALVHPNDHTELDEAIGRCLRSKAITTVNLRVRTPAGWLPVSVRMRSMAFDDSGRITRLVAMLHLIEDASALQILKQRDRLASPIHYAMPFGQTPLTRFLAIQAHVMKMVLHGDDLQAILEEIARMVEQLVPEALCSILLLSENGKRFERSAGLSLPPSFHQAVLELSVDPATGSCGAAAYRRTLVVTADIATDPLWRNYQALAAPCGLAACFSMPFFGKSGQVLGTVAIYHQKPGPPGAHEIEILSAAVALAGVAVSSYMAERRIRDLASYDSLTGLPNRDRFQQLLEEELQQAAHRRQPAGLLSIDIDHFRMVNESVGQKAGDAVLRQAARRLRQASGAADELARVAADEFIVLVRNPESLESVQRLAHNLVESLAEPVEVDQRIFRQTVSIGFCIFPEDGADAQALMRSADLAMSQAKARGGNMACHYGAEMLAASMQRLALRADLAGAAERGEMMLFYQPKLDLGTGRVMGVEALLRWAHPRHGMLSPAVFIPLAESSGDIIHIGHWVLNEACRQIAAWRAAGEPVLPVAVNLSARQFADPGLVPSIESAIRRHSLDGSLLELEVTESLVIEDPARAASVLSALQQMGMHIAVDDFGTGHSSLAQLKRFPVDSVKIDRSFVQDIPGDQNDTAIITAIIAMGHALGLKVIAEGVEHTGQLSFLQAHGCDAVQGYYFSRPLSVDRLREFMRQHCTAVITSRPA